MKFVPSKIIKSSSRSKGKDLTDEIEKWRRKIKERSGSQISASPLNLRIECKSPELKVKTKTCSRRISNIGAELNRKHINKIVDRHEDLNERNVSNEGNYRGLFIIQPNQSCANKITRVMVSQEYPLYQITPEENHRNQNHPTPINKFINSDHMKIRDRRCNGSILKCYAKMSSKNSVTDSDFMLKKCKIPQKSNCYSIRSNRKSGSKEIQNSKISLNHKPKQYGSQDGNHEGIHEQSKHNYDIIEILKR